jgi:hypothetical protein
MNPVKQWFAEHTNERACAVRGEAHGADVFIGLSAPAW